MLDATSLSQHAATTWTPSVEPVTAPPVPLEDLSDARLVRVAQDRERSARARRAFDELMRRHLDEVRSHALRLSRDAYIAEEVVQDSFLAVFRALPRFRGDAAFSTWLYRITRNATLRRLRRRRETTVDDEELFERLPDDAGLEAPGSWATPPDRRVFQDEARNAIEEAMAELPELYREAFLLRNIHDLPVREIAERTGLSVAAVKTRAHRARNQLRAILQRERFAA